METNVRRIELELYPNYLNRWRIKMFHFNSTSLRQRSDTSDNLKWRSKERPISNLHWYNLNLYHLAFYKIIKLQKNNSIIIVIELLLMQWFIYWMHLKPASARLNHVKANTKANTLATAHASNRDVCIQNAKGCRRS